MTINTFKVSDGYFYSYPKEIRFVNPDGCYKLCVSFCGKLKPISEFHMKSSSSDGYQNVCKTCNSEIGRRHYQNNKEIIKQRTKERKERIKPLARELVLFYLKDGCVDCGEKDLVTLDFDHLQDKSRNICDMVHDCISLDKLEEEISKCEVRCANCHRRKTAKDFDWWRCKNNE